MKDECDGEQQRGNESVTRPTHREHCTVLRRNRTGRRAYPNQLLTV